MHKHKFIRLFLILGVITLVLALPSSQVIAESGVLLTKTANTDNATIGDTITYTYIISNNSTDNLTGLQLTDDKLGEITVPSQLNAGDSITVDATHIVSVSDYSGNADSIVNIATVTSSENITATATESVALIQYEANLTVNKEADKSVATIGDTITYTYTIINEGVVAINNIILNDTKLGNIPVISDNVTISSLAPGENITTAATYKVVFSDLLAGSIKNIATVTGEDPNGQLISSSSGEVEVSTYIIKALLTKAEILKASGVQGKGIDKAPGLQKPFNPNSQAVYNAGKKEGQGYQVQNRNQELNGNTEQKQEQEMNSNNDQDNEENGNQEGNKNKEKNKNKKQGKNK